MQALDHKKYVRQTEKASGRLASYWSFDANWWRVMSLKHVLQVTLATFWHRVPARELAWTKEYWALLEGIFDLPPVRFSSHSSHETPPAKTIVSYPGHGDQFRVRETERRTDSWCHSIYNFWQEWRKSWLMSPLYDLISSSIPKHSKSSWVLKNETMGII